MIVLVTRHWGGLGLALLAQRQGSDVVCAYDYRHVKPDEFTDTNACGQNLVDKMTLDRAMKDLAGQNVLWAFDGNDMPKEADLLRDRGELVIGTSELSQRLEDDRDYAAQMAEAVGFRLPQTEKFTDYPKAIDFLQQHDDRAWVYKPDKQDPTATYVPLDEDPTKANDELREYLTSLKGNTNPSFIVQEVVNGIEANFDLWLRDGRPVCAFGDVESKRKLVGDLGENVGCAGDYLFGLPIDAVAIRSTVARYLGWSKLRHYTGTVDVNVMIVDGQPLFLENCFRFGYNAYPTIFQELAKNPIEDILREWVTGTGGMTHHFHDGFGGSLSLVCDHPKMGTPVIVHPEVHDHTYLYRCYEDEGAVHMVAGWSELVCVTARGDSIPEAGERCLERAKGVAFPGKGYRNDLAKDDLKTLPEPRYRALQQMGWVPMSDADEALEAFMAIR